MGDFFWFGSMLGLGIGALHALIFVLTRVSQIGGITIKSIWHGLGIWALWVLFGGYILFFWLIGWVVLFAVKALPRKGQPQ